MAGFDTVRGIAFQHAYAIQLALDVVEDLNSKSLTIEGAAEIVDVELARKAEPTRPIFQPKSRTWPPGEIADVIRRWGYLDRARVFRAVKVVAKMAGVTYVHLLPDDLPEPVFLDELAPVASPEEGAPSDDAVLSAAT
jgi:hypothetical protein